jgi:hypothetical protein
LVDLTSPNIKEAHSMARGDHLKVRRWGLVYAHHGIDLGDGMVVHFSENKAQPQGTQVVRTSLEEFLRGGRAQKVRYSEEGQLDPEETVRLALEALEHASGYHLDFNNCEHFATWCKTGKKQSRQVWRALAGASSLALVVAVGLAGRFLRRR